MPLTFTNGENDIMTQLRTITGVDVMEGEYAGSGYIPTLDTNKLFKPYMLVKFNGGFSNPQDNGIVGSWLDTYRITFSVYVVAPDDNVARVLRDQVRGKMINATFKPTDGSALGPIGGVSFVDSDLGYNRYVHNIGFKYYANLS